MSKARRVEGTASATSKGRVRVVFIDMEAQDETLSESIRALTAAISQAGGHRRTPALPNAAVSADAETLADDAGEEEVVTGSADVDASVDTASAAQQRPRRRAPVPQIVDVKLPAGKMDLENYFAKYKPKSQIEKGLVCTAWWRDEMSVAEIGPDHLYTCFRMMKWTDGPNDYRVPFADMERKKEWLAKGNRGFWKLNHIGEKELARLEADASKDA